ncbi:hypoxia inducible factor 1 subunit alpha a [Trichomycterus rosablanca]|uniref:hypoxia inducible factor 1 subunit alpha a n=1 Tax=Trichomycterus rosablanca TaxID=2290929 RepID=UPI002F359546
MTSGATADKKRQSSERRKARCRDAARCRRVKETEVFTELANQLPLHHSIISGLDKASVIRLTLSYLHLRSALNTVKMDELELDTQWTSSFLKALDGFLMILSKDGDVVYVSENVSRCLGIPQLDLSGQSVFDFSHPCDHEEIREMLVHNRTGSCKKMRDEQSCLFRMKCTLTNRGRTINIRSATWKVLRCSGHIRVECTQKSDCEEKSEPVSYLVLICEPIPHPADIEVLLDSRTFLSKHTLDMRFIYCDDRITELLGYDPEDLLHHSVYEFYHALDSDSLTKTHHNLMVKGQACTGQYRMLVKSGGFVWVETQATVIYNNKNSQPQCVICLNYVLSGVEEPGLVLSLHQSAIKEETEDKCERQSEREKQDVVDQEKKGDEEKPETSDEEMEIQTDIAVTLDFSHSETEVTLMKDEPLYNDVMLPSILSPLSPVSEAPCESINTTPSQLENFSFPPSPATNSSSCCSSQEGEDLALEMLAPYISMDDDYQLQMRTTVKAKGLSLALGDPPLNSNQENTSTTNMNAKSSNTEQRAHQLGVCHSPTTLPSLKRKLETIYPSQPAGLVVTESPQIKKTKFIVSEALPTVSLPETLTILLLPPEVLNQLMTGSLLSGAILNPLPNLSGFNYDATPPVALQHSLQGEELQPKLDQVI